MLAPEESLNGEVHEFASHVLVRSDYGPEFPEELAGGVVLSVEVLYTDEMGVRVSVVSGRSYTIGDASMDDLLSIVDEAEGWVSA